MEVRVGFCGYAMVIGMMLAVARAGMAGGQHVPVADGSSIAAASPATAPRRTRLILKDGSYQVVLGYTVLRDRVQFRSAERGGEVEEIPLKLVDLPATKRWETEHSGAGAQTGPGSGSGGPPALDPELAKEEADRAAMTPEVAPDLRLPELESVVALDTWRGTPELIPLTQSAGELNRQTGHSVLRGILRPGAVAHQMVQLKGEKAAVQMHVPQPAIYLRIGEAVPMGSAITVDTHGAENRESKAEVRESTIAASSQYVVVRVDVRQDARIVTSFETTGSGPRQEDVVETDSTILPGGHWRRIVPREALLTGEYALVEVISEREINLGVWDFGVHPTAPENRDAMRPEPRRPARLERHRPE